MKKLLNPILLFMLTVMIAACDKGGGGDTPVPTQVSISNLQYTASTNIIIPYQERFFINGTLDYTNAQSGVTQVRLLTSAGVDLTIAVQGASASSGTIIGSFEITMPTQPGSYTFQVWIVDGKGNSSNKLSGAIQMNVNDAAQAWVTLSQQYALHDVISKGGMFIGVGENGTIVSSTNGAAWTQRGLPFNATLRSICWTGNQYVVVGSNNAIMTSPDGNNWIKRSVIETDTHLYGVASSGNHIVAVGLNNMDNSPQIIYSTDGINWTRTGTTIPGAELSAITWSGSKYVAVGVRYGAPFIMSSPNGLDWEITYTTTAGPQGHLVDIVWSGSRFVATGAYVTAVSTDGVFWNINPNSGFYTPGVTWTGNKFVAVALNQIYTSPDGVTWTKSADVPYSLKSIAWSGTQYIAVGFISPVIMSSP